MLKFLFVYNNKIKFVDLHLKKNVKISTNFRAKLEMIFFNTICMKTTLNFTSKRCNMM